jgi:hypothetical protein
MKRLKIYESFRTEQEIKDLCSKYGIWNYQIRDDGSIDVDGWNYQIRDDGSIDVDGYVSLWRKLRYLKQLPLTFNEVKGFGCGSNKLTTLEGCPIKVVGDFSCSDNKLTSLEHSPKIVGKNFYCGYNDNLTSLDGLENTYIGRTLHVGNCSNLYSLKGFPKKVGSFDCSGTPIQPIYDTFIQECDYETMRRFNKFDVIYTDGLDWFIDYDNLGKFLRSVGRDEISMKDFDDFIKTTEYKWEY